MHVSDLSSNHQKYSQSSILSFVLTFIHPVILPLSIHLGHMVWVMPGIVQCGMGFAYMTNFLFPKLTLSTKLSTTTFTTSLATLYHVWYSTLLAQSCLPPKRSFFAKITCSAVLTCPLRNTPFLQRRHSVTPFVKTAGSVSRPPLSATTTWLPTAPGITTWFSWLVLPSNTWPSWSCSSLLASFSSPELLLEFSVNSDAAAASCILRATAASRFSLSSSLL